MTTPIRFTLELEPVAKGRPRFSRQGHAYTPGKTRAFEKAVRILASPYKPAELLGGPLVVVLKFILKPPKKKVRDWPTCKPDVDNLKKAVTDALTGIMWRDDAQIVISLQIKEYDWETRMGRIEVTIAEVEPDNEVDRAGGAAA